MIPATVPLLGCGRVTRLAVKIRRRRSATRRAAAWAAVLGLAVGCAGDRESRLAEIRGLQEAGEFATSIQKLEGLLEAEPELAEANYRLGMALVQTGEPSRAVWPLQKAAAYSDYEISAGVLLASTHFQTRNYDQAIRAANRVLEADPDRDAAMRIRANAHLAARNAEAALADTRRLVELHPDDYGVRALHASALSSLRRLDEAEREHALLKRMGEASDDPAFASRACLAPAIFADRVLGDAEKAKALYDDCARDGPTDPIVVEHLVNFFDRAGESARGTGLWKSAVESAPDVLELRRGWAARLRRQGESEEALAVLREAAEHFDSAAAWGLVVSYHRSRGESEQALAAIEKVLEGSGPDDERARFIQADLLIDLGELERAERVAAGLEQAVYAKLLRGRIHLMRGEPAAALAEFEEGIRAWPGNAAARFLAGIAARDLGDYERAISELRESVRADNRETDAAVELARLHLSLGQHQQALATATLALRGRRGLDQPEAYAIAARALTALDRPERARRSIDDLEERGFTREALVERMILERARSAPDRAVALAEESGLDLALPENRVVLEQLVDAERAAGAAGSAVARVEGVLERSPESARLHELRAVALDAAGRRDEARDAFARALALDPESAAAHAGIASLDAARGDVEAAVEGFDRAYRLDPADGRSAYASAQLLHGRGDVDAAATRLREVVRRHPALAEARNDLAWILAERGEELDRALELAQGAAQIAAAPDFLDTLGWVHYRRGEHAEAVAALERALALAPGAASTRYRLGLALRRAGEPERAREMFESALAAGAFAEADAARRELAELAGG